MRAVAIALAFTWLAAGPARAYSEPEGFLRDPSLDTSGGGGGIFFTGSPRQYGLTCTDCHQGGPTDTGVRLSALDEGGRPVALATEGWKPGALYELEVAFDGDRLAPPGGCSGKEHEPCDLNLFSLEILDEQGNPAGSFCSTKSGPRSDGACGGCGERRAHGSWVVDDCHVVLADGFDEGGQRWRNGSLATSFFWRAPEAPSGALRVWLAGVDGRGRESPEGELTTDDHDGTFAVQVALPASGGSSDGCASTGAPALLALVVAALARRVRSRRR